MQKWIVPPNVLDFSTGSLAVYPLPIVPGGWPNYDGTPAKFYYNSMYDKNGDLLFFVIDGSIYDREGYYIELGKSTNNPSGLFFEFSLPELLITRVPNEEMKFYIINVSQLLEGCAPPSVVRLSYNILDLCEYNEQTQRYGKLTLQQNIEIPYVGNLATARGLNQVELAITKPNINNEQFVFLFCRYQLFRFRLDVQGIQQIGSYIDLSHHSPGSGGA